MRLLWLDAETGSDSPPTTTTEVIGLSTTEVLMQNLMAAHAVVQDFCYIVIARRIAVFLQQYDEQY